VWPAVGEDDPNYAAFFAMLQRVQWSGGISIEGAGGPEKDGTSALAFLRRAVARD
jgi:sugar phosphate isomerase/epimerase